MFRVNPHAVCRQLLAQLKEQDSLTADEQVSVQIALQNCGVPNAIDRLLAGVSTEVLNMLLGNIREGDRR